MRVFTLAMVTIAVPGCSGSVDSSSGDEGASGGNGDGGEGGSLVQSRECSKGPAAAGQTPAIRLTKAEYLNTMAAVFPDLKLPALDLPPDDRANRFNTLAAGQTPAPSLIERYAELAAQVAAVVKGPLGQAPGCGGSAKECASSILSSVGERAFRRPLTADERQRYEDAFTKVHDTHGKDHAVEVVVRALLQSPAFLFRAEQTSSSGDRLAIKARDLASRLSYLLWDAPPDQELVDAAEAGKFAKLDQLEVQARRLLDDPKARLAVAAFHRQWLGLFAIGDLERDAVMFPEFKSDLAISMQRSTEEFAANAFWQSQDGLSTLLTSSKRSVDATLARFHKVSVTGSGWQDVELDAGKRAGILTDAGLMASLAHEKFHSPVMRGQFVMQRFLCESLPAPPANTPPLPEIDIARPTTTRQRFEMTHENGACASCHKTLDALGFPFENFDAIGRYRTEENGLPIDSAVNIEGLGDIDGTVANAVELGQKLANSETVRKCVARQWLGYSMGIDPSDVDECTAANLAHALKKSGGNMKEMLVSLVKSDAFRYAQRSESP